MAGLRQRLERVAEREHDIRRLAAGQALRQRGRVGPEGGAEGADQAVAGAALELGAESLVSRGEAARGQDVDRGALGACR
jgi:hypothetical protein